MMPAGVGEAPHIAQVLERDGLYVLPEYLSADEIKLIAGDGLRLYEERPAFARVKERAGDAGAFFAHLIPVRLSRHDGWSRVPSYRWTLSMPLIRDVADRYLGRGWGTSHFIFDRACGGEEGELFPLHFDNFDKRRCLKVYFYLTACGRDNGAFRYVPRSHRLAHRVMWATDHDENRLAHLLELVDRHCDLSEDTELRECYERLRRLQHEPERAYEHVIPGGPGTMVLFDTAGVHGGGRLTAGERYVARCHLVDSWYVLKHLPDQLPATKRVISRAWELTRRVKARIAKATATVARQV
jgi:hypothetical protein